MGKSKPPKGMYRESVHDGTSVTESVLRPAPPYGKGKHSKSPYQRARRHVINRIRREIGIYV